MPRDATRDIAASIPSTRAAAVTPSDSLEFEVCRGLFVGGVGDVAVILADDNSAVTFKNCNAGTILPVQAKKVMLTNTTATNILALY